MANILVTLDGKFSMRTNATGGFEFPAVVSGAHTLTVLQDDLPLPWTLDSDRKIEAPVSTPATSRALTSVPNACVSALARFNKVGEQRAQEIQPARFQSCDVHRPCGS